MDKRIDLTGQRFGRLVVLEFSYKNKSGKSYWKCKCDCGNTTKTQTSHLRSGGTKSCGCFRNSHKRLNITGQRFGRLIALQDVGRNKRKTRLWECQCDCGKITIVPVDRLKAGRTNSCGCLRQEGNNRLPKGEASFNRIYLGYKRAAEQRKLLFCISKAKFKKFTQQACYYCKTNPVVKESSGRKYKYNGIYTYNGIDRVNNSKGYVPGNIVACCTMCNRMKMAYSQEKFLEQVKKIYECRIKST